MSPPPPEPDWPARFEEVVRPYLPLLGDHETLEPDASLRELGLDSMATVNLMMDVETAFSVQIPDDDIVPATFATASSLWRAVARLCGS